MRGRAAAFVLGGVAEVGATWHADPACPALLQAMRALGSTERVRATGAAEVAALGLRPCTRCVHRRPRIPPREE